MKKSNIIQPAVKKEKLHEFKMTIAEVISYVKARTCHTEYLHDYSSGYVPGKFYQVRKAANNQEFILMEGGSNAIELYIKVDGYSLQRIVEQFDIALSKESTERGILQRDLDTVKFIPKKYKK
jgi:hypothetical protein